MSHVSEKSSPNSRNIHSNLIEERIASTGISMPDAVYLFGGTSAPTTSEVMRKHSSHTWNVGPVIPGSGIKYGCGVRISSTELVLIGGSDSLKAVRKYNTKTNQWTDMKNLKKGRQMHNCAMVNKKIIVSGGNDGEKTLMDTEIIPLSTENPRQES